MDLNFKDPVREIRPFLANHEQLQWSGIPKQGLRLKTSDKMTIPFSIFWTGFACLWEFLAYTMDAPLFFLIFGFPFILVGIYLMFIRFFVNAAVRKNTYYGITNERIICVSGRSKKSMVSLEIKNIASIALTEQKDGSGTITFTYGFPGSTNGNSLQFNGIKAGVSLLLIPEVKKVYNKIVDLKKIIDNRNI